MITSIEQFNELANIINLFSSAIPEGIDEKLELDGVTVSLFKNNGKVELMVESKQDTAFDDSDTRKTVKEFKESIEKLDDSIFIEVVESLKEKIDVKRFNKLLDLEHYDEKLSNEVVDMMNIVTQVISDKLQNKIKELTNIYSKF